MSTRLPTWGRWLVAVSAVVVLAPLVFGAVVLWSFSGGWDGLRPQAQADDRRVVRARAGSGVRLDGLTAHVLAAAGATASARVRTDDCRTGMNDWKNHDGYTLRCGRTDVLVVTGAAARTGPQALDARLRAAGLRPAYDGGELTVADRTASYRLAVDERATVQVRLLTPPVASYDDPLTTSDARAVEGDADAFHDALVRSRDTVLLLRPTWRYFED